MKQLLCIAFLMAAAIPAKSVIGSGETHIKPRYPLPIGTFLEQLARLRGALEQFIESANPG